ALLDKAQEYYNQCASVDTKTKHASTWLNGGWDQEYETVKGNNHGNKKAGNSAEENLIAGFGFADLK
ncbi:MAG: hypothetical protein ACUZ8H_10310, partial [Candidatus Anammoxibacter sp.]